MTPPRAPSGSGNTPGARAPGAGRGSVRGRRGIPEMSDADKRLALLVELEELARLPMRTPGQRLRRRAIERALAAASCQGDR